MKFLVNYPIIKWLLASSGIIGLIFTIYFAGLQSTWHLEAENANRVQQEWLELDKNWNAEIISRLKSIEDKLERETKDE